MEHGRRVHRVQFNGPDVARVGHGRRRVAVDEDDSRIVSHEWEDVSRVWRVAEGGCVVTSDEKAWDATICALYEQGLSFGGEGLWLPELRAVTYHKPDGSKVILETYERRVGQAGELSFSDAYFAHCAVEAGDEE